MKTVAIDTSPLETGHSLRGIGSYTRHLASEFKKGDWKLEFEFFTTPDTPPPADLIHHPYFDLFTKTLPSKKTAARGVTIHDVIPLVFPQYFPAGIRGYINLLFQKKSLKNTDFVICDSEASKSDIIDKLSYPKEKTHVVYLAAGESFKVVEDSKQLESVENKFKLPKEFALYVGDVNWNKNLMTLITAVSKNKIPLVLVGQALENNDLEPVKEVNNLIRSLKVQAKIIKTGYVDESELVAIYNLANLTVLPSFYEGFGLPVLESMACGTPVVCTKGGSLSEIAGPAIICDAADASDIAEKIIGVFNLTNSNRAQLSKKSMEHSAKFTWEKTAQETVNIYKKFL